MMKTTLKKITKPKNLDKENKKKITPQKKMTPWDLLMKYKDKPLFTIAKEDEELVYGSNMMVKLLQED